jgi:TPR repeat protein
MDGDAEALFAIARRADPEVERKRRQEAMIRAASLGHSVASALCLAEGWGVPEDDSAAAEILTARAAEGDAAAQCALGVAHLQGNCGVSLCKDFFFLDGLSSSM